MVYYMQRECNFDVAIPSNSILQFETSIALSHTGSVTPPEDFQYREDGSIDILRPGSYTIFWFVVGMTGFATDGQSYGLKKFDYSAQVSNWVNIAKTTDHIKNASTPGFAIIVVSRDEITEYGKATIALFNTADSEIELTLFFPKAGILIFGLDLDSLENRLTEADQEISNIFHQLQVIADFVSSSGVTEIRTLSANLAALGAAVINSGYTYNFWGIGTLNHVQTLNSGQTYYLIESSQYEPLTFYQGTSTISTLWIETPYGDVYSFPIRFDASGIFFTPDATYYNLPAGTAFKFTQALILTTSSAP